MRRTACVDVGSFPLQLLLRRHPDWRDRPAAVVSEDKPLGTVVAVNRPARAAGVRVGMRYAAALSLVADLQAGTVGPDEVAAGVRLIIDRLLSISPFVEGAGADERAGTGAGGDVGADAWAEPGVFWVDVSGLQRHHPSLAALAQAIRRCLHAVRFSATVVIGYTRFGTYLLARDARRGRLVVSDAASERSAARRAPLERLPLEPVVRDLLEKLDVATVDDFLRLPYAELLRRFGPPVAAVHRSVRSDLGLGRNCRASGRSDRVSGRLGMGAKESPKDSVSPALDLPVQGDVPAAPFLHRTRLSYAETDAKRLQRHAEVLLDALLGRLRVEDRAVEELQLRLLLEDGSHRCELIRPAAPTGERRRLIDLLALRLRALDLSSGVEELALDARHVPAHADQTALFHAKQHRDLAAGSEALARIRAQFGNRTVLYAVVLEAHLPEAQFRWQSVTELVLPQPGVRQGQKPSPVGWLVRRMLRQPAAVPPPRAAGHGPFLISGGWWQVRGPELSGGVDRAYYFIRSPAGALEWVFYDRLTGRWYLQGWVE